MLDAREEEEEEEEDGVDRVPREQAGEPSVAKRISVTSCRDDDPRLVVL